MRDIPNELLEKIQQYRELGINPLALATGCAVKVDLLRVVYPAMKELRSKLGEKGLTIASREDADIFARHERLEIHRRVYSLDKGETIDPEDIKRISPSRAVTVIQIYQRYANNPERFAEIIGPIYTGIAETGLRIYLGKGHSIITPFKDDQFALFDFVKLSGKKLDGYTAVNNDTIHIIDPTDEPGSYRQIAGALSNSLNDLFVLGVHEDLRIAPVINAPSEDLKERIWEEIRKFCRRFGIELTELQQPERGRLLMGATSVGNTNMEPPVFEKEVRAGMRIIVSRPMGELAPINVYVSTVIDESIINEIENQGISAETLENMKDKAVDLISTPNVKVAEVISKYLPPAGERYDPDEHIALSTDITGPGIYVVKELAERANAIIRLDKIPVLFPELSRIATKLYIIPNATAGTNGAYMLIAPKTISDDIVADLRARGLDASVIGEVVGKGEPKVIAPQVLREYVADDMILQEFELFQR